MMRAELAIAHLRLRLHALEPPLRAAVAARQAISDAVYPPGATALHVTADQVERVLAALRPAGTAAAISGDAAQATSVDDPAEVAIREHAAAAGVVLPLDAVVAEHDLSAFERDVLVLCAAPEIDRGYERVFGFIVDDLARGGASVELCCALGAPTLAERLARRRLLGPFGALRRTGLIETCGEAITELGQQLRLAPALLDALLGGPGDVGGAFVDPAQVAALAPACGPVLGALHAAADALRAGTADVVALSGGQPLERREAALALARRAHRALRRLDDPSSRAVRAAVHAAAATGAILWVPLELVGAGDGDAPRATIAALEEQLACAPVPLCLTSAEPWRPLALLVARRVVEVALPPPSLAAREQLWAAQFPALDETPRRDLAARFRIGALELQAAALRLATQNDAGVHRATDRGTDDHGADELTADEHGSMNRRADEPTADQVAASVRAVAYASGSRFAHAIVPRRGPDDLVLEPALHAQVLEVARFHRAWPSVAEDWGFGRLVTGGGGVKALFTGDPGTGKTLAAEVIAAVLGQTLLRVDLAHVVSKWIGETEKNLDEVFRQAERGQAVLFFDEAEALFGKRSEVRHGTDRYANMEVSFLLQRLEDHGGLVILASNLRDQLDAAFTRRFQLVLHFPRPAEPERRRLWRLAFPPGAPLACELSPDSLANIDLTGAAIVGAARTAGLLAAASGSTTIELADVREAIRRELARDGRFMPVTDLTARPRSA
jgi:hypothetical protein